MKCKKLVKTTRFLTVFALVLLGVLLFGAPSDAQAQDTANVSLALSVTESSDCASVSPDSVTIYTEGGSPRAVQWTVSSKDPDHAWKMEYAPSKPGASAAHFGSAYWIPCGSTSSVTSIDATATGTWVYEVKVYDCVEGEPDGDPFCTVDPQVIIDDPPDGSR